MTFKQVTLATPPIHKMEFHKRKCMMDDEDLSKYGGTVKNTAFHKYTRRNCIMECISMDIMKMCGCLPYYFPDLGVVWGNSSYKHLGLEHWGDTSCNKKEYICIHRLLSNKVDDFSLDTSSDCKCPSDCEETIYYMELSFSKTLQENR